MTGLGARRGLISVLLTATACFLLWRATTVGTPAAPGSLAIPAPGRPVTPSAAAPSGRRAAPPRAMAPRLDPRAALAGLDAARAVGYAAPGQADARAWLSVRCSCYRLERQRLAGLARRGRRLVGVQPAVRSVRALSRSARRIDALVTDALPPYLEVGAGRPPTRWGGRGPRTWHVALARAGSGWRITRLEPWPPVPRGGASE